MRSSEVFAFGGFELETGERRLTHAGRPIALAPKALDLLIALVRNSGRLVTKRELLDVVWPDTFVEEGILSVHISSLRKALGEPNGGKRFIETVSRAGYRFVASVSTRQPATSRLRLVDILPADPEVHELIGRGRAHLLSASRTELPKAADAFRAAIDLDPTYAAAHAGLALACCAQAELRVVPHAQAYDDARSAALRALAMDDASADAQVALGCVLFFGDWNWTGARRAFERALELNPDHTEAHLLYGRLLEAVGELDAALAAKRRALERDPFSPAVHIQIAHSYWNMRRYDEVIEWATKTLTLDPRHPLAREYTAGAWLKKGNFDRHMAESIAHAETHGVAAEVIAQLEDAYDTGGRAAVVRQAIDQCVARPESAPAVQLALLCGEAGELDEAFRHLDRAIDRRDPSLVHLAVSPQWDVLRGDPRFAQRLATMGLPPISAA